MNECIMNFIGENTARLHKEYLNTLMLKYSILKKSASELSGLSVSDIKKNRGIRSEIKAEAIALLSEILAHELYFSSFGIQGARCERIKSIYGSESSFLYSVLREALNFGEGYCFIVESGNGIYAKNTKAPREIYLNDRISPKLCIDLYEHAYYGDYGFDREAYLSRALYSLNLSKLS